MQDVLFSCEKIKDVPFFYVWATGGKFTDEKRIKDVPIFQFLR